MSDPTTTNKGLTLPTNGGDSGTWGPVLNNNVITPLDLMLGGVDSISLSSTDYTLSATEIQNLTIKLSGTLLANVNVFSSCVGFYCLENNCTGSFTVTHRATSAPSAGTPFGSSWVIPQGVRTWFVNDATSGARPCPTWLAQLLLAVSGSTPLTIRRTENDTTPRKAVSIQSGSGSGNDYSITETGDGSNNVATVTEAIGATTLGTKTATLLADAIARSFASYTAFAEISTPSAPSSGNMNFYAKSGDFMAAQTPGGLEYIIGKMPTVQRFTSGTSATYTPTAGTVKIRVRIVGGGGGAGAAATNNGTAGNNSSFTPNGGSAWTAVGGGAGIANGGGGAGGTGGTNGTGTLVVRFNGSQGAAGQNLYTNIGGVSVFGGAPSAIGAPASGQPAQANSGAGGSGGTQSGTGAGGGGGGGEYVEFWCSAAQLNGSATYTVGASAAGGVAGTQPGGAGAAGIIIIEEFYS